MKTFPCTSCGACCRSITKVKELAHFNHNGVCIHLQSDNSCAIYENRPLVCRVDDFHKKYLAEHITKKDFYNRNIKICNELQEKFNIDKNFRIEEI